MVKKLVLKDKVSECQEVESVEEALKLFMDNEKVLGSMEGGKLYVLSFNMVLGNYHWISTNSLIGFAPMLSETVLSQLKSYMDKGELFIFDNIAEASNYKVA